MAWAQAAFLSNRKGSSFPLGDENTAWRRPIRCENRRVPDPTFRKLIILRNVNKLKGFGGSEALKGLGAVPEGLPPRFDST